MSDPLRFATELVRARTAAQNLAVLLERAMEYARASDRSRLTHAAESVEEVAAVLNDMRAIAAERALFGVPRGRKR